MVLLSLIAIGVLTLSTSVFRSTDQSQAQLEARANARLALQMAIGRLQKQLGPDQRINAPADLLSEQPSLGQEKWIGVLDSWDPNASTRPATNFKGWLVSGNETAANDMSYLENAEELVTLVNGKDAPLWTAPRVSLDRGSFAYAIIDENSKARIATDQEAPEDDLATHLAEYQSAAADVAILPGLESYSKDSPDNSKLITSDSAQLIASEDLSEINRSYSVWADGLLTDVRKGGFRKDLSLRLGDDNRNDHSEPLYSSRASRRGGITFQELKNFHDLSSRLTYNASNSAHLDGDNLNSEIPTLLGEANQTAAGADPHMPYLRPIILRASWHIAVMTRERETSRGTPLREIYIVLEPIVTLWNPHDVNISMQSPGHMTVRCWGLPYDFTINGVTKHFTDLGTSGIRNISMAIGDSGSPINMRPGEVLIFSRGRDASSTATSVSEFSGQLGWNEKGGFALNTEIIAPTSGTINVSLTESTQRGANKWGLIEFLSYVGADTSNASWTGGIMIDRTGLEGELAAADFPEGTFVSVPARDIPVNDIFESPEPLAVFSLMARTEQDGQLNSRYLSRLSPAAMGFDHQDTDANTIHSLPYEPSMKALSGGLDDRGFDFFNGKGFFGGSYKSLEGQSYIITHSVPREAPLSLASFQHAHANGLTSGTFRGGSSSFHDRILQPSINHAIGNSFAPSAIAADAVEGKFNNMDAVDHSWLVNDALWDDYFVSSLAERNSPHHTGDQTGTADQLFERFIGLQDDSSLLPNQAYRYAGTTPEEDRELIFDDSNPTSDGYLKVASLLRVHGAFNVNSTDPLAWQAFLSSTRKLRIPVENSMAGSPEWEDSQNPIPALLIPKASRVETSDLSDSSSPNQWQGYRDPTDEEMMEFAQAMVEEVKTRGPFISLSDFINRRVGTDTDLASKGAMQAALDNSLNATLETGPRSISEDSSGVAFPEAERGSMMTHVPGHVKQADILTSIGSRISVRSDTFTIRAYGEALDASGEILATAHCEAVVRREAEWVNDSEDITLLPDELTQTENQIFGRRFSLISFHWVKPSLS